ncbi:MAG: hypothetical protein ACE15C_18665 [Phycisphaerae bacterium]
MPITSTGIREVLGYAQTDHKIVTVMTGSFTITGKVLRVNPLILEASDTGQPTVINLDVVQAVSIQGASGEAVISACAPQAETRLGTRVQKF